MSVNFDRRQPLSRKMRDSRLKGAIVFVLGLIVCGLAVHWDLALPSILLPGPLPAMFVFSTLTSALEWKRNSGVPFLMSPGMAVAPSIIIGSITALQLGSDGPQQSADAC